MKKKTGKPQTHYAGQCLAAVSVFLFLTIFQPFGIDDPLPSQIVRHNLSQALIVFCVTSFINLLPLVQINEELAARNERPVDTEADDAKIILKGDSKETLEVIPSEIVFLESVSNYITDVEGNSAECSLHLLEVDRPIPVSRANIRKIRELI